MTLPPVDITLIRALHAEPRAAKRFAADRMLAAGLIEEFGPAVYWPRLKRKARALRLTPAGEADAKLPRPRSLMLEGPGDQFDCVHEADCLGGFVKANPRAEAAHCPALCASRKDVDRHAQGLGSSSLALMQDYAVGCMR